jgi:ribosomal protein L3 glutamine methyltransferase
MSGAHTLPPLPSGATVSVALNWAATQLQNTGVSFGHGTTNAQDEAAWLVLWQLGMPLDTDLAHHATQVLTAEQTQAIDQLIAQRIQTRKPAAYLTGEAWLQGVPFYIDERAIVPRSLIAELIVDGSVDHFLNPETRDVLDLCTGNGSLGILAALAWPDVQVTGADISTDALAVAERNIARHQLQSRMRLQVSDGLQAVPGPWDLIICNPPYVNASSMTALPPEYQAEPALALAGGADGMDFIRPLLQAAPASLRDGGVLILEIGNERDYFEAAFAHLPVYWLDTSAGADQVLLITRDALTMPVAHGLTLAC